MVDTNIPLGRAMAWPAPAKLNLCLHIVGRRPDGYHLLQTAMQFIELRDQLRFFVRPANTFERIGGLGEVPQEQDLVIRAARALAARCNVEQGVAIEVQKRIPVGGGLGGGSSDAATTLVALNRLWGCGLSEDELAELGVKLGADVPLFVRGRAAWAEGVGERLVPLELPEAAFVVIQPDVFVSTAAIFQASELTRNSPITTIRAFLAGGSRNDCTATVRNRYPEVSEALDWLGKYGEAKLTGTGACVFAVQPDLATAQRVLEALPARWRGFAVRGVNRSPLLDRLAAEA